jgi:Protein of unknown function (DUF1549)/Protein of unknown function (DUF1553)
MAITSVSRARRRRLGLGAALLLFSVLAGGLISATSAQDPKPAKPAKKNSTPRKEPITDELAVTSGAQQVVATINQEIEKKWKENKIEPSDRCSDYDFIRRASLDLIGRIARRREIEEFMKDPPRKRRSLLIERLLASDEYAMNMADLWTALLLTRTGGKIYHEQMRAWLQEQFQRYDANWSRITTELLTASGKTSKENGAVNFVLAHLGEKNKDNPREIGHYNMVPITSRTTRLFLGLRIQCIQCHDHKFNDEWKQHQFWGINAFFRQVDAPDGRPGDIRKKKKDKNKADPEFVLVDDPELNPEGIVPYERRTGVLLYQKPTFVDGTKMLLKDGMTRRQALADMVVKNEYFAKTFVNRMWAHFMGRGFTRDVDDWGDHNPTSHLELVERLAKDWAEKANYNPRELIRWICNSRAYGLSCVTNPTNDKTEAEQYFSRMLVKAMTPEQLFESIMTATQAPIGDNKESRRALRNEWLDKLVLNFGDDEGNEITFNGTVVQALLLMNGAEINKAIMDLQRGTVATVLKLPPRKAVEVLYLAALNRPPTTGEMNRILSPQVINMPRAPIRDPLTFNIGFYQDLMWALLNSNEFILNH